MTAIITILAVDDEEGVLFSIKKGLEAISNYTILTASTGEECFKIIKENKPDLILLDIMMPGMDGWQVQQKLSETKQWKDIPLIFLSAKSDNESKKRGNLISYDYIEKPFEITELKNRIDQAIQ